MAQLGDLVRAKALLRRAARTFGPEDAVPRARCVVAEAEIALGSRDLGWAAKAPVGQNGVVHEPELMSRADLKDVGREVQHFYEAAGQVSHGVVADSVIADKPPAPTPERGLPAPARVSIRSTMPAAVLRTNGKRPKPRRSHQRTHPNSQWVWVVDAAKVGAAEIYLTPSDGSFVDIAAAHLGRDSTAHEHTGQTTTPAPPIEHATNRRPGPVANNQIDECRKPPPRFGLEHDDVVVTTHAPNQRGRRCRKRLQVRPPPALQFWHARRTLPPMTCSRR